jgi:hypothetical protein
MHVFITGSCCVVQAGLTLVILLPLLPECWDYRYALPHSAWVLSVSLLKKTTKTVMELGVVIHVYNPQDLGGGGRSVMSLKAA